MRWHECIQLQLFIPNLLLSPLYWGDGTLGPCFKKALGAWARQDPLVREKAQEREVPPSLLFLGLHPSGTRGQVWSPPDEDRPMAFHVSLVLWPLANVSKSSEQNKGQSPPTFWNVLVLSPRKIKCSLHLIPSFITVYQLSQALVEHFPESIFHWLRFR